MAQIYIEALKVWIGNWVIKSLDPWMRQKFNVSEDNVFIGLIPKNAALYTTLQNSGYTLNFIIPVGVVKE